MALTTTLETLRFAVAAVAAIATTLVLNALYRRMRKTAHRATEALFFSVLLTDWLLACAGVAAHVVHLVTDPSRVARTTASVTLDAVFDLAFVATVVWTPILAAFVLSNAAARFVVRTSWLVAWTLGGVYAGAGIAERQAVASANATAADTARQFRLLFLSIVCGLALAVVLAAAAMLYGRKFGFLAPSPRLLLHEKLLRYVLVVALLQLPLMLATWLGDAAPASLVAVADCLALAVPILNAFVLGAPPSPRWRLTPPTAEELVDKANAFAADKVTLEALDGLSDIAFVAEGAAGAVYRAHWLGIDVALKVLKLPNGGGDEADAALYATLIQASEHAFIEEASICARLRHPNVTLFIRAGHYDGKLGLLTEFCARGSLKDVLLKRDGPLPWRRKVALALDVAKGLTYLHARNPTFIHRDLKSTNILVTDTWQAKLADFGISKVATLAQRTGGGANLELTLRNNQTVFNELTSFAGTWRWNAPEILVDPHNCRYSRATDMYSFGIVLWEVATNGAVPFHDVQFDFEVRDRVVRGERPALEPALACPEAFTALLTECWAQDPTARPSATQATARLTALLATLHAPRRKKPHQRSDDSSWLGASSVFSSLRGTTTDRATHSDRGYQHSLLPSRVTSLFFRSRGSTRSSTQSEGPDDTFAKYASPYGNSNSHLAKSPVGSGDSSNSDVAMLGLPLSSRRRAASRGFEARLSMLREYDAEATPSDISTALSSSSAESIMSPIVELPVDAMLEASGTFIDDGTHSSGQSLCSELASSGAHTDDSVHARHGSSRQSSGSSTWGAASKTSSNSSRGSDHWGLRSGAASADRSAATERLRYEYDEIHACDDRAFVGSRIVGDVKRTNDGGIAAFL